MSPANERYIPALRFHQLTPLYDPVLRSGLREMGFKRHLVRQMSLRPGMRVLDLGRGTGTLTTLIKTSYPEVEVIGLDADPAVLALAVEKANKAGVAIRWDLGLAYKLPYPTDCFDRVVSSLVIHHLTVADKQRTFVEARRVLRPGGELHILDFGRPHNFYTRVMAGIMRHFEETAAQFDGFLPEMLAQSGFEPVEEIRHFTTIVGPLVALRGIVSAATSPRKPEGEVQ